MASALIDCGLFTMSSESCGGECVVAIMLPSSAVLRLHVAERDCGGDGADVRGAHVDCRCVAVPPLARTVPHATANGINRARAPDQEIGPWAYEMLTVGPISPASTMISTLSLLSPPFASRATATSVFGPFRTGTVAVNVGPSVAGTPLTVTDAVGSSTVPATTTGPTMNTSPSSGRGDRHDRRRVEFDRHDLAAFVSAAISRDDLDRIRDRHQRHGAGEVVVDRRRLDAGAVDGGGAGENVVERDDERDLRLGHDAAVGREHSDEVGRLGVVGDHLEAEPRVRQSDDPEPKLVLILHLDPLLESSDLWIEAIGASSRRSLS